MRSAAEDAGFDPVSFSTLVATLREVQDAAAAAVPSGEVAGAVTADLRRVADALRDAAAAPTERRFGRLEEAGRGQTMCPPLHVRELDGDHLRASVRFGPFHGGFGEHAHGGAVALVLNEAMGMLANASPDVVRLAAYVHVDYRSAAVLGHTLALRADVAELTGRKQTVTAALLDGERTVAEGEGLFLGPPPAGT